LSADATVRENEHVLSGDGLRVLNGGREIIAFFDPGERQVRVFAYERGPNISFADVVTVFQPRLSVYATCEDTMYHILVDATPIGSSPVIVNVLADHAVDEPVTGHVGRVTPVQSVCADETESGIDPPIRVTGDLWEIIRAVSRGDEPWTDQAPVDPVPFDDHPAFAYKWLLNPATSGTARNQT